MFDIESPARIVGRPGRRFERPVRTAGHIPGQTRIDSRPDAAREDRLATLVGALGDVRYAVLCVQEDLEEVSLGFPPFTPAISPPLTEARTFLDAVGALRKADTDLRGCVSALRETVDAVLAVDPRSRRRREAIEGLDEIFENDRTGHSAVHAMLDEAGKVLTYANSPVLTESNGYFGATKKLLDAYRKEAERLNSLCIGLMVDAADLLEKTGALLPASGSAFLAPVASMFMHQVDALHHSEFEQLVAELLDRDGYRIVRSGGGSGDMGADVVAEDELGRRVIVQCKHFQNGNGSVGQPVVQHVYGGAVAMHRSTLAVVVTNGRITGGAKVWAKEDDRARLIDREALKRWCEDGEPLSAVLRDVS
ncbi:restriction endonuclease [Streptomyces showdoensis]|uniref:restriction endonuclease n=1 Tax=Streptomyces showdoensis TaxID=68268 RepID=UPI0013F4E0A3|nr:restriction endonuclease [Streptomyces showdoensis]